MTSTIFSALSSLHAMLEHGPYVLQKIPGRRRDHKAIERAQPLTADSYICPKSELTLETVNINCGCPEPFQNGSRKILHKNIE